MRPITAMSGGVWAGGEGRALVSEGTLYKTMRSYLGDAGLKVFVRYCQHTNGLLMAEGVVRLADAPPERPPEPVYAFPHMSFEEYLTACYLQEMPRGMAQAAQLAADPAWREVVRFLGECLCFGKRVSLYQAQELLECLCPVREPMVDADWRRVWLAGELLQSVRKEAATGQLREELDRRIVLRLVKLLETPTALEKAPQDRAAAGRDLARLGDPRAGIGLYPPGVPGGGVPQMAWVAIPGTHDLSLGEGMRPDPEFSSENEAWPDQAEPLKIEAFYLAAYPVTVAQYRPFVEAGGYRQDRYWTEAGCRFRDKYKIIAPDAWDDPRWSLDNHPVIGVSWYEAVAYCRWLDERLHEAERVPVGLVLRLPTEAEWEWAARGPEGHRWPWGDEWQAGHCNGEEAKLGRTSAVGSFAAGASHVWRNLGAKLTAIEPCQDTLFDMVGNVWEWCSTRWQDTYPLPDLDSEWGRDYLEGDEVRVLRGGAWWTDQAVCRGAARFRIFPVAGSSVGGFRCCVSTSSQ
jgi:formylglycine-generating enzyme required for sulfatase activity